MQVRVIHNILHVRATHGGRRVWVAAPALRAHARTGSLTLSALGHRPLPRGAQPYRPQVQACKTPRACERAVV